MIVENKTLPVFELPGLKHRTIAGHAQGVKTMEVWCQTMAPDSATPIHRHACEEVILILSGSERHGDVDNRTAQGNRSRALPGAPCSEVATVGAMRDRLHIARIAHQAATRYTGTEWVPRASLTCRSTCRPHAARDRPVR